MKSSILFRLSLLLCFSSAAVGQGRVFLANNWAGKYVPIMILDPQTEEVFGPSWPDWRLEVRAGPKGTADKDLQPLRTNDFQPLFNAGCFIPFSLTVPDVPAGAEAAVKLLVFHRERPAVKVPLGTYTVTLTGLNERGPTLPPDGPGITNAAPKELLDLLPRRPAIPGEPKYKGRRLSDWFSDLLPGPRPRNVRFGPNGDIVMPPRVLLGPGIQGQAVAPPQDGEDDAVAALRSAGAAGIPVLLQYSAPDKMMTGMVVRRVYLEFMRLGLREKVEQLALASLDDTNPVVVCNALILFPCTAAESETPRLIEFVRAGQREIRRAALQALYRCKTVNPELLPLYRTCLETGDTSDQGTVLRSLKAYGPIAKPLLPVIEPLFEAKQWMLRVPAAAALWAIDGRTNFLPALVRELEQQPDYLGFFSEALRLFAEMGPAAKPAVPAILKAFEGPNQGPAFHDPMMLRREAEEALKKIEPGSEEKLPPDPMRRFRRPPFQNFPGPIPGRMPAVPPMPFG